MKNIASKMLLILMILIGGLHMANAQEKPPLLNKPPTTFPNQAIPSPRNQTVPPPPPSQVAPQPQIVNPFNQLNNAVLAVNTAKKVKAYLTAGKIWTKIGRRGETEIKAAILYEGVVVAVLHFNPIDGSVLPLGLHPIANRMVISIENIREKLPAIIHALEVLNGAEYREPESVWVIPLAYKSMIVAHLKIYIDGIHIVPDYPANQEMQLYGK